MHAHQEGERPSPDWFCDFARELPNVVCVHALQPNFRALVDVGFIFIDGDHSYDGCLRDTKSAFAHLSSRPGGGIMAWHDVYDGAPEWVGVERAINTFDGAEFEAVKIKDSWVAYAEVEGKVETGNLKVESRSASDTDAATVAATATAPATKTSRKGRKGSGL
jgi:hypothetical protein